MFRARERGMSFWPFVVSLLLLIVFVIMWFSATTERDEAKAKQAKAEAAEKKAQEDLQNANKNYINASTVVGYTGGGSGTSPEAVTGAMKDVKDKIAADTTVTFPQTRFQEDPSSGKVEKTDGGMVTVTYLSPAELAEATTLESLVSKFDTAVARMKYDLGRSYAGFDQAVKDKEAAAAASDAALKDKDKRIAEVTGEKSAVENQAREKEAELKEQIAQKDQKITQAESDLDAQRKQSSANEAKLVAAVAAAEGQVRTLVQRDAPVITEGPDGEVIVADDSLGIAIINRGRQHWLMPGTVFDVLGRAKGGALYKKGEIKVTSVDDETARAAITVESAKDPITKGDLIQSLVYSPNRKMHFTLIGDFKKMGRSQAEALLRKQGAIVDDQVTSETNYLVVGMPAAGQNLEETAQYKAAKDLGTRILTEEQLASFAKY